MSAIAHWIEQHGISTVVIGLIRLHLEKTLPPRSLWVPFELGRPLGAPTDSSLQHRVLLQALQLVETTTARQIVDFAEEDTRAMADPAWQAPQTAKSTTVRHECEALGKSHNQWVASTGRTSVGVTGLPIEQCADIIDHVIEHGVAPSSARDGISDVLMLRLAVDDIKAYYTEAALNSLASDNRSQSSGSRAAPSSRQIDDWFWLATYAGTTLAQLREKLIVSDDARLEGFARRFIVPHRWRLSP